MPAKDGIAEEADSAMIVSLVVVGGEVFGVQDAGLFRLRSLNWFLPSDSSRSLLSLRNCGCEKAS
jgi:hypothetical protein